MLKGGKNHIMLCNRINFIIKMYSTFKLVEGQLRHMLWKDYRGTQSGDFAKTL